MRLSWTLAQLPSALRDVKGRKKRERGVCGEKHCCSTSPHETKSNLLTHQSAKLESNWSCSLCAVCEMQNYSNWICERERFHDSCLSSPPEQPLLPLTPADLWVYFSPVLPHLTHSNPGISCQSKTQVRWGDSKVCPNHFETLTQGARSRRQIVPTSSATFASWCKWSISLQPPLIILGNNLHMLLLPHLLRSLITQPVYSCRRSENLTLFFAVLQKCLRRTNEHHLLHLLGPRRGPFASLSAHVNAMEKCFVLRCHSKKICHNVSQEPTDVVLAAAAPGAPTLGRCLTGTRKRFFGLRSLPPQWAPALQPHLLSPPWAPPVTHPWHGCKWPRTWPPTLPPPVRTRANTTIAEV